MVWEPDEGGWGRTHDRGVKNAWFPGISKQTTVKSPRKEGRRIFLYLNHVFRTDEHGEPGPG